MILDADEVLAGYAFVARRLGVTVPASERGVRAALDAARMLASGDVDAEPAAVFFAFASYRRAFPGAWRRMAMLLAGGQARANGVRLLASGAEMDALCTEIMHHRADFAEVRQWFATRTGQGPP